MPELDGVAATARLHRARRRRGAARGHAHDLRPRRVRVLGPPRRRQRLPAQGRRAGGAARGDPRRRDRRRRRRAQRDAAAARAGRRSPAGHDDAGPAPGDAHRARARRCCWRSRAARRNAEIGDAALHGRGDGQDARRPAAGQARRARPRPARRLRLRERARATWVGSRARPRADGTRGRRRGAEHSARDDLHRTHPFPAGPTVAAHLAVLITLPSRALADRRSSSASRWARSSDGAPVHVTAGRASTSSASASSPRARALLTLGLVRPWGERVPRLVPRDRRPAHPADGRGRARGARACSLLALIWGYAFRDFRIAGPASSSRTTGWTCPARRLLRAAARSGRRCWPLVTWAYWRRRRGESKTAWTAPSGASHGSTSAFARAGSR